RGASKLALAVGISPLVIGLTIVAYGTSAPEMAVSVQAAFKGEADIAIGNVIGSNIFNVLFILGASALIAPLIVSAQLVRLDVPLMIGISFLLYALGLDGSLSRLDGALLFTGIIAYTTFLIVQSRRENAAIQAEFAQECRDGEAAAAGGWVGILGKLALIAGGLALLVVGSRWLVDGAQAIARSLGVSELVIGLTIIAVGTSLPEVATSIVAAIRGERDIAVGNAVGSNIFNVLSVLGLSGLVSPRPIAISQAVLGFDVPAMIAVAVACLPICFTGYLISRWEGVVFLGYYAAYVVFLVLSAAKHDALPLFSATMLYFIVPLTALTLAILAGRSLRLVRAGSPAPPSS
ncbi:MAG: calcium/sodium antiporter, partial [Armatimonadetes bacterium]|nr:calcium/sodium antiporter [Armatimonadota bacterium]